MIDKYIKYLPLSLFGIYFLKALTFSVSYPEACILAVLGAITCYFLFQDNDNKLKEFKAEIDKSNEELKSELLKSKELFNLRVNEVESIKAQINALKLNSLTRQGFGQAK